MGKKRRWTNDQLKKAVIKNVSMTGTIRELGLKPSGGNHRQIRGYIRVLNLDTSHWTGQGHLRGKTHNWTSKIPMKELLVADKNWSISNLRRRIIREKVIKYRCKLCGITTWKNKPLSLHLDHINGNHNDHRLENLRFLCPNCHSQTPTYANKKR